MIMPGNMLGIIVLKGINKINAEWIQIKYKVNVEKIEKK